MSFEVNLVSPEGPVFSAEADMVVARTPEGDVAFQPRHIPFVGVLVCNQVKVIDTDGVTTIIAVHRGFVEVSGESVTVLSDVAELSSDIDVPRAEAALERANATLDAEPDDESALEQKRRALNRIEIAANSNA